MMRRLGFVGAICSTILVLLAACATILATLAWLLRQWEPAPWLLWTVGLTFLAVAVAVIVRWWRLPAERRFRFSLRGMLLAFTLFALWFGVIGTDVLRWGKEGAAVVELAGRGVEVEYYRGVDLDWHQNVLVLGSYNPFVKVYHIRIRRDQGLPALLKHADYFPDLEFVSFEGRGVSDAALLCVADLSRFAKLHAAGLDDCNVTNAGLDQLTKWTNLETFTLFNCSKVTDTGLAHLRKLPNLEFLILLRDATGKMPITDAGMTHVASLHQLEELILSGVPVTDSGIARLRDMPNLKRVRLGETKVTEDGIRALCEALPNCFVSWDKANFPAASQIRQIAIWSKEPRERQLVTITEHERIMAIKEWLEQQHRQLWGQRRGDEDGCLKTSLTVRFEGQGRTLCEIGLGNGLYLSSWGYYYPMSPEKDEAIRTLLGVDAADWNTSKTDN